MKTNFTSVFRLFALTTLFAAICSCAGFNNVYVLEEEPHFTLDEVYSQKWVAGVKDGGSGTHLHFTTTTLAGEVRFMHAFFKMQKQRIVQNQETPDVYMVNFPNQDMADRIMDVDPTKEAANKPGEEFPFDLDEDEAVLSYLINGELKFYKVGPIAQKPMLAYPGAPDGEN